MKGRHRVPPKPAHYDNVRPGVCRWCNEAVVGPKGQATRSTWHPACVRVFKLIYWPAETRKATFARDKGICAACGVDSEAQQRGWRETRNLWHWLAKRERQQVHPEEHGCDIYRWAVAEVEREMKARGWRLSGSAWQHDHIRPLVEANGDLSFWQLDNIQTLCTACHVAKTTADNRRRRLAQCADAELLPR